MKTYILLPLMCLSLAMGACKQDAGSTASGNNRYQLIHGKYSGIDHNQKTGLKSYANESIFMIDSRTGYVWELEEIVEKNSAPKKIWIGIDPPIDSPPAEPFDPFELPKKHTK